ncbi:unnamed protein product [Tilletia laevis]|nr:unnamed protein product [Tilletia laevis]
MQLASILLLSSYSGLRPSSLVRYEIGSSYARVSDVKVVKRGPFDVSIELSIKNLKGFNHISGKAHSQRWIFKSAKKTHNAGLDLSTTLIPLLIDRGVLYEAESGRCVPSADDFISSRQAVFVCHGDSPLFLAGSQVLGALSSEPLTGSAMALQIAALCTQANLPRAGSYAFRHEAGNRMAVMLGAEAAKSALGHGLKGDVTRSGSASDYDYNISHQEVAVILAIGC